MLNKSCRTIGPAHWVMYFVSQNQMSADFESSAP